MSAAEDLAGALRYPETFERLAPSWRASPSFTPWQTRSIPWESCDPIRKDALRKVWRAGDLSYKLDPDQLRAYHAIRQWARRPTTGPNARRKKYALDVARRWGKSSLAFLIAVEERLRRPRTDRVAYWCDTNRMCEEIIILEAFPWLFDDCPPELRPEWYPSKHRIIWGHDARSLDMCRALELAGLDDPNRARGRSLAVGVADECGFMDRLSYIDGSIISKMLITVPDAFVLFASTPPWTPSHYWTTDLVQQCRSLGAHYSGTIYDCPRLSTEEVELEIEATGGPDNPTVRRELFAEHIVDETMAVLPEAEAAFTSGTITYQGDEPAWRNCYVSMDPGWGDCTGVLFAWIDFDRDKLIVEDEWLRAQAPSSLVADAIRWVENNRWQDAQRWSGREAKRNPHLRFTDVDKRLVADLRYDHGLPFVFTEKDNLQQQINRVRNWILSGRIEIHPRCEKLTAQMRTAVYKNEARKHFKWEGRFGHYDLVSALVYLCRNVEPYFRRNPNPPQHFDAATHHIPVASHETTKEARIGRARDEARQQRRAERFRRDRRT